MAIAEEKEMIIIDNLFREKKQNVLKYYESLTQMVDENESVKEIINTTKNLYSYVKNLSVYFYRYRDKFSEILKIVSDVERILPKYYIMSTKFNVDKSHYQDDEIILNHITLKVRQHLWEKLSFNNLNINSLEYFDLTNYCKEASKAVQLACNDLKIKSEIVLIEPGFIENSNLYYRTGIHYFNIIEYFGQKYLIDCTYSQFFLLKRCNISRIGIPRLSGCSCGIFMYMTESRRKVAEKLLRDGWIRLTDDVLKDYLDGFAISYRNGLYYEETKDFSFTTNYTAEDYYNFLNHKDNQLNYEEEEFLGFQRRPLKNPNLSFNKR